jgi:4,5-dihydroxyphthalate decarboxylase
MTTLRLSLAIGDYAHTADLANGRIRPIGIELIVNPLPFEEAAFRFGANLEFDISEFSLAMYCALLARREARMIALPVFTSRVFRHSSIYIHRSSGILKGKDLIGRKVGIPQWSQTATIYVRGYLEHYEGVPLASINWVQAGVNQPGRRDMVQCAPPSGVRLEERPDHTLSDMLVSGEIDAAITARPPKCFLDGDQNVQRLFPNYREEEERYFARTGIFPIMHVVAIRRELYEAEPWIARNLFDAFSAAKAASMSRLGDIQVSYLPSGWVPYETQRIQRMLFPEGEPWPYGLEPNRRTLDAFLEYCEEQGVTERALRCEELFPKELALDVRI